jgi:hypothetical protein
MSFELQRYIEPLNMSELTFLENKESKERSVYYKTFRILMIMCFIIPFAGAWYRAADGAPNAFSKVKFFFTAGVLLSICSIATYLTYRVNLRKLQLDIRDKTKTIEINHVVRKLHMAGKNAWYFYIDSKVKLSIEVSSDDYYNINEGDEICIEYATHSRLFFGYF